MLLKSFSILEMFYALLLSDILESKLDLEFSVASIKIMMNQYMWSAVTDF